MREDRLLLLAYYFPPIKSIGVVRNYFLAQQFAKRFSSVQVFTTSNHKRMPKEEMPSDDRIAIQSIFTLDYRSLMSLRGNKESPHLTVEAKENFLGRFMVKLLRSFPFNLLIGEGGLFYILSAFRKGAAVIRKEKTKVILYSSFPTYSDHAIAYLLRRFYSNTYWVADFRDLHTDPLYHIVFAKRFQHWCNKQMLRRADLVTTVSQGLADQLGNYHPNVHVLSNGVELRVEESRTKLSKFSIAYTGSLFTDERDPRPLLLALRDLIKEGKISAADISLIYAGKDGQQMKGWVTDCGVEEIFDNRNLLSRQEALALQQQAHINLLLTSSHKQMSGILTGKLFEYLATGNPILLLIKGIQDAEFESIFNELSAGCIAYNDDHDSLKKYIMASYTAWKQDGKLSHQMNLDAIRANYSWEKSVSDLLEKIDK